MLGAKQCLPRSCSSTCQGQPVSSSSTAKVVEPLSRGQCKGAEEQPMEPLMADARVFLIAGALLCFGGSLYSVYVAVTHDPNKKEDRPILKRGEYMAGASIVGALVMTYVIMRR